MKAEELNKLMEAYNSMYAPKEEVVESEQLEEGMGLSVGAARLGAKLLSNPRTPEAEGAKNLQRNLTDPVGFAVKGALKKVGKALLGDKPITAGGGTPDTQRIDDRARRLGGEAMRRSGKYEGADLFDIVKGHLVSEGLTEEEAIKKMVTMTEEERNEILEGLTPDQEQRRRDLAKALYKVGTPGYSKPGEDATIKMQKEYIGLQKLKGV